MLYAVDLRNVTGTRLLVVRRRASLQELSSVIPEACGVVWTFIRKSQIRSHGRNVAVYLNDRIDMEVGVEVGTDAAGAGDVTLSTTPSGIVATTTHFGPYARLNEAHWAVQQWCDSHRHQLAGPNWEVYGHWSDDPATLRTDVFYVLTSDANDSIRHNGF